MPFYGKQVDTDKWLPAGITGMSAALDLANGLPSYRDNAKYDVFPDQNVSILPGFPTCPAWPSNPPRGNLYCNVPYLYHPIASPVMCPDWSGSPPMWLSSGQEQLVDGVKLLVQTAFRQGVNTTFFEYEAMLHCWPVVFADSPQSQKFWEEWATAIVAMAEGKLGSGRAAFVRTDLSEEKLQLDQLVGLTREQARVMSVEATKDMRHFTGENKKASKM